MEGGDFKDRVVEPHQYSGREGEESSREVHGPSKGGEQGLRSHPMHETPEKMTSKATTTQSIGTPTGASERRSVDAARMTSGGFAHMASEAAVYRSTRLHGINPTAAVSDDISFYYTLDSGRVPPAALAANPESSAEFVRNTATQSHGGMFRRLMKPIK